MIYLNTSIKVGTRMNTPNQGGEHQWICIFKLPNPLVLCSHSPR